MAPLTWRNLWPSLLVLAAFAAVWASGRPAPQVQACPEDWTVRKGCHQIYVPQSLEKRRETRP